MVVLFDGEKDHHSQVFHPSSILNLTHKGFKQAYSAMASRANLTLGEAVEKRYELISALSGDDEAWNGEEMFQQEMKEELDKIGKPGGEKGSAARTKWFEEWVRDLPEEDDPSNLESIMSLLG